MIICNGTDNGTGLCGIYAATLREILRDSENVPKEMRCDEITRQNIALYLHAFGFDANQLTEDYGTGISALKSIKASSTYRGFADFLGHTGDYGLDDWEEKYKCGYYRSKKSAELYQRNGSKIPECIIV